MSAAESALRKPTSSGGERLSAWLTLARISNSPTVVSNVLVGAAIAGATQLDGTIAALAVAMVAFYTAGMFLNDVCDYSWDLQHRPDRPLVVGVVTRPAVLTATVVLGLAWGRSTIHMAAALDNRWDADLRTWALTGAAPNPLAAACDEAVCIAAARTSTVQEAHLVAVHLLCEAVERHLLAATQPHAVAPLRGAR